MQTLNMRTLNGDKKNDFIEILSSLIDERNKKENILLQCLTMFAELRALKNVPGGTDVLGK